MQILWTLIALATDAEDFDACIPTALYLTDWLVRYQYNLFRDILEAERTRRQMQACEVMLQKLGLYGPCVWRELARHCKVQRKELHEPVLRELIGAGKIREHPNGLLEVVQARPAPSVIQSTAATAE
jgi:hypothetical protein